MVGALYRGPNHIVQLVQCRGGRRGVGDTQGHALGPLSPLHVRYYHFQAHLQGRVQTVNHNTTATATFWSSGRVVVVVVVAVSKLKAYKVSGMVSRFLTGLFLAGHITEPVVNDLVHCGTLIRNGSK